MFAFEHCYDLDQRDSQPGSGCKMKFQKLKRERFGALSSGYSTHHEESLKSLPEVLDYGTDGKTTPRNTKQSLYSIFPDLKAHLMFTDCTRRSSFWLDDNQNKTNEKKEKKMVVQKPRGTMEYTAGSQDTLNTIALKFNITPNKLVELNKLFTHTIVPGQVLFVPDTDFPSSTLRLTSSSPGATISPSSSDAEYDKLPDADLARKALKPIERVLSSTSEEDEPVVVKFLKMNCRYFTDGKGVVGGVMIVTPNNIMFDPHKSDPLVIENGCEEYGLICPMEEVVSIALYNDISHMKIKDALPSDLPQDLCPLYRPGEWEDLASEKDINPFSKFKSLNKEKRLQNGETTTPLIPKSIKPLEKSTDYNLLKPFGNSILRESETLGSSMEEPNKLATKTADLKEPSKAKTASDSRTKENSLLGEDDDFVDLEELSSQTEGGGDKKKTPKECLSLDSEESRKARSQETSSALEILNQPALDLSRTEYDTELKGALDLKTCEKQDVGPEGNKQAISPLNEVESMLNIHEDLDKVKLIEFYLNKNKEGSQLFENLEKAENNDGKSNLPLGIDITLSSSVPQANEPLEVSKKPGKGYEKDPFSSKMGPSSEEKIIKESMDASLESPLDKSCQGAQVDSKSEIRLWLLKRIQVPIEDMLPSKEEKSKTPPMFLCIKVGKPMRKSFATHSTTMVQQFGKRRKQPEYWFAVPRERVDHLYTFFVQCSPEVYGKDAKEQGFVVVEKEELNMVDNFFSEPTAKSWEIITVEEAKRRKSTCSYYEEDDDESLPVLTHHSALLENMHIEQLARRLPARVQGYPWRLAYSTIEHGTSLKTLYRKSASLDSPVLLVIKDMDNQIFGAYATHPFKFSDHYYGTGETFLYTFSPNFKVFKWSGENSYFINGDISSLELGGGGGRFGLWLDADLYHGRSNSCSTFNNDILSKKEDFIVQDIEVWTFE
ncbi:nuclear receptor coactivator 7 isoform X2 [Petaurus breviceps papuanus]|uniref:nuclear receptor coactivator 7 isoform X2 n=1 Tax=Petaurus breviceps papuanus TaxID=3040969 RepID=UPI0036D8DCE4